tara:strand:+ start:196 stop:492 length:297 start_codon:yes stop_codon:yes gene_type:complete
MASKTTELVEHVRYESSLRDGARGVVQVDFDSTNVTLYGSLNGTTFVRIQQFTEAAIKEIALTPYLMVGSVNEPTRTLSELQTGQNFANTEVYINETR